MHAQEIREAFLDFFAGKGHKIVKSSPLLPQDDPTLLFTNAGMNQFKNTFLGLEKRSYKRAASVQKCMRVSGKHNDLEQVGKTNKHHTFFEMLGNFSFGDYFKEEAISYAWELVTEGFRMKKDRLYITVYEEDDEAFRIWNREIGIPEHKIFRFGKEDNYWAMGETGPCGPCSEIHYDLGEEIEKGPPRALIEKGSDRFLELWNLVFMQYHQAEDGEILPLPSPSIDTGMGLERVAAVLQGKRNNFDTDLFAPLIAAVCELSPREYPSGEASDVSLRIIADHIRAVTFLIGDGIVPSNEGRGYVLRRLIRRAFRQGNLLGLEEPFLYELVGGVVDIMKDAYPELLASANYISKVCLSEESRFSRTLSSGLRTFNQYVRETMEADSRTLTGKKLFKLYDTFGFPLDLSRELAEERNLSVDEKGFRRELEKQRSRARRSWKGGEKQKEKRVYEKIKGIPTRFVGYEASRADARVAALLRDGAEVESLTQGEAGEVFLDVTPFYAEAGGQVGDTGVLKNPRFSGLVETAYSPLPEIIAHRVRVLSGKVSVGDSVEALIDARVRKSLRRNHTATHLLHASLRQVLGDHVKQAGSLVSPSRLRFDFTHFSPVSPQEIRQVEALVNEQIREDTPVETRITTMEEGIREGAIAIFEEKYGEKVRMVVIGGFSKELCGGIHVHRTGEIGLFKIVSESSVAAGMRRIEALTGEEALRYVQENETLLEEVQGILQVSRKDVAEQIERLKDSLKEKEKENRALRRKLARTPIQGEEAAAVKVMGVPVLARSVEGLSGNELRELADSLKQKMGSGVVILGTATEDRVFLVAAVSRDLTERIRADAVVKKLAPMLGGGGGGRADFAQAGGTGVDQLKKVLEEAPSLLAEMIAPKITPKED